MSHWMQEVTGWLGGSEPPAQLAGPVLASAMPLGKALTFHTLAATGIPEDDINRSVRVFLCSSFPDMQAEREALARSFCVLQNTFRARGVELLLVDLRSGVAEEDLALDLCLSEVERCKPWFIGLLGEHYGTPLTQEVALVQESFPAIRGGAGRSLTELEIVQGVLANPDDALCALFFERDPAWLERLSPEERPGFAHPSAQAWRKLESLKTRVGSVAQIASYPEPAAIGAHVEAALGALLEARFPAASTPDAFTREHRLHAAYARERLEAHAGAARYLDQLDAWVAQGRAPALMISGASGAGKSTLVAHWLQERRARHPEDILFAHYLGASSPSADPARVLRRLWEHLNRATGEPQELPPQGAELLDLAAALTQRLSAALLHAQQRRMTLVIALDGLDHATVPGLKWLPLAPNVKLLVTCLDEGPILKEAQEAGWRTLALAPLEMEERRELVLATLAARGQRELSRARLSRLIAHEAGGLPLFLVAALEEIAAGGAEDTSGSGPLGALTLAHLHARVLERIEQECGEWLVRQAFCAIWVSRCGVEEADLIALTEATPLAWARFRNSVGRLLRDREGRLNFSHDTLRAAVQARCLSTPEDVRGAHLMLADQLAMCRADQPQAAELPYHLMQAEAWDWLAQVLLDLDRLAPLRAGGDAQLLAYWQGLCQRGANLEELLCGSFWARLSAQAHWTRADIDLAIALDAFLRFAGDPSARHQLLSEELTRACTELLGPQDPCTQASLLRHAQLLGTLGDLEGAQQVLEPLLEMQMGAHGGHHPATLATLSALSGLYMDRGAQDGTEQDRTEQGRTALDRAQQLAEQLLEAHSRVHGELAPVTVRATFHLTDLLRARGELERAQPLTQRLTDLMMLKRGAGHPQTLQCMEQLAQLLQARGELPRAQQLHEQVLERRTRLLGAEHPQVLSCTAHLAQLLTERGDIGGAHQLQERLVEGRRLRLGPEHPETLKSTCQLAQTLLALGDTRRARTLLAPALPAMMRKLGPEHPDTLSSMGLLAAALHARGELEAARKLGACALQGSSHALGPEHPRTLAQGAALAETLLALRDTDAAQPLIERLLAHKSRTLGAAHPDTLVSLSGYAEALHRAGGLDAAQQLQERLVERHERHLGAEHPGTLRSKARLGGILVDRGQVQRAAALLEEVLEVMRRSAPEDPDTLASTGVLASILAARGKLDEARKLEEQVLAATLRHLGPAHPETLGSMRRFAQALMACGNWEGVRSLIQQMPAELAHTAVLSHTAYWCKRLQSSAEPYIEVQDSSRTA